jgi:hypothetical protein
LATDVPDVHVEALVFNGFDIKSNGWNCGHVFTEFEFVEDGCFACGIETEHQTSGFAVLEPFLEDIEETAHWNCVATVGVQKLDATVYVCGEGRWGMGEVWEWRVSEDGLKRSGKGRGNFGSNLGGDG